MVESAKVSCGTTNLCAGLECGIEGSLHAVREIWPEADGWERGGVPECATVPDDEEWDLIEANCDERAMQIFIPPDPSAAESESQRSRYKPETGFGSMAVDAYNGFGEIKRYCMLYNVRHLWVRASRFVFNRYRHFNINMCWNEPGEQP